MKANKQLNHTASHLLATAVLKLFPNTKLGFGPAIDEGFYYDFKFEKPLLEEDLKKIKKEMQKITKQNYILEKHHGEDFFNSEKPFKKELYDELKQKGENVTFYAIKDPRLNKIIFNDLCLGNHIQNVSEVKHFELLSIAGAYWRGNSDKEQLTRIYGTAWETQEELDQYLDLLKERKERDHRTIAKNLDLFMFSPLSGLGFPIWLENGMKIKNAIMKTVLELDDRYGFDEVHTPIVGEQKLYETSGHWAHYKDDMYPPIKVENENLILRPMTCPHHILIFNSRLYSYRDLPKRFSEQSWLFRHEKSGALTGFERVRALQLTEGHIFARKSQIVDEFKHLYKMINEALSIFGIKIDYVSFSRRDPKDKEKFYQDDKLWETAEKDLETVLKELKIEYKEMIGEAAFYGPKIDFQVRTVLNHEITMSTLQLDFLLPEKFDMSYVNENNEREKPVLIHRGLIGTYERFLSILLEQNKGVFPFWLAPKQFAIAVVNPNDKMQIEYADSVYKTLKSKKFHVYFDNRDERLSKKIREAQISKTKYIFVIGEEEAKTKTITIRAYGEESTTTSTIENFLKNLDYKKA
ncbi:threonine--tRNA ligase [[Mycoplasma] mobile]|uniref:Threonine--tRNA ligase n=1 Tax=Mycoplasma mobile (strain ATCC 43663 / 163K / NCTC 11711) TaxID=267748 RepID=Q6KH76_MYCM1|nr:threonine--tRNA ligase [[Mycoplasma] mobile]AAT28054.1 threonyl-tRNA synthetase [Mycoplasma mobile 163K]